MKLNTFILVFDYDFTLENWNFDLSYAFNSDFKSCSVKMYVCVCSCVLHVFCIMWSTK